MSQLEKKYQDYVQLYHFYTASEKNNQTLADKASTTEKSLMSAREKLHALEQNHESQFTDLVDKEVKNEFQKLEKQYADKLKGIERQISSATATQTDSERQFFSELEKNKEQVNKLQVYKSKVKEDMAHLSTIFPDKNVEEIIQAPGSIAYDIQTLSSMVPKDIVFNEGDERYYDLSRLTAYKYVFAPMLYKAGIVPKKILYIYSGLAWASIIGMFFTKLSIGLEITCPLLITIIVSSMLHSKHNTYFFDFTTAKTRDFYHFVLHGEHLIENYTKAKLGITTKTLTKLEEDYRSNMSRLKNDLAKTKTEVEANLKRGRELAEILDSMKGQSNHFRNEKEAKDYESRYNSIYKKFKKTRKKIEDSISRETRLKEGLKAAEQQFHKDNGQLETLSGLETLFAEKKKVLAEQGQLLQELSHSLHAEVTSRHSKIYEQNKAAQQQEISSLSESLKKQTEDLQNNSAEAASAKETCRRLSDELNTIYPTIEETRGALSPSTYVLSKQTSSEDLAHISVLDHQYQPCIILYKLNENVANTGNVTAQLEDFLRQIIEGFLRTNAFNSIQQSLVDTITGGKFFRSAEYNAILNVYEKPGQLKQLADQIEDATKKVVNSQMGTIAEANKARVAEANPPFKYQIVYIIVPPFDSSVSSNIVSEDIWRLMHDGHKYGFLPIFFIKESEWSSFVSDEKSVKNNMFAQLKNVVDARNIYHVDLIHCRLEHASL